MIKYLGLVLIAVSSFTGSILYASSCRKKLLINERMLDFIRYVRCRIQYFRDPLSDIYEKYEDPVLSKSGFLSLLSDEGIYDALCDSGLIKYFLPNTAEMIRTFSEKLGKTGLEEQNDVCRVCDEMLQKDISYLNSVIPGKIRVYSSLFLISGLAVVLLLI